MVLQEVKKCYVKPFNLFHYNKPKQPALKDRKGPIDFRAEPQIPIRSTNTTRMRDKVIKDYMEATTETFEDFHFKLMESGKRITQEPEMIPRDNKTSHYRYKWVREVPVVSCRFTEHVMMFKKPPFTFDRSSMGQCCGQYRLRNMEIKDPVSEEVQIEEEQGDLVPGILM